MSASPPSDRPEKGTMTNAETAADRHAEQQARQDAREQAIAAKRAEAEAYKKQIRSEAIAAKRAEAAEQRRQMAGERTAQNPANAEPAARPVRAPAALGRFRSRHWTLLASFVIFVVLPIIVAAWYLYARAADQYASNLGFSVRKEEVGSAVELLGGITELSGSSSSDTDILYKFLQSQKLVARIDQKLDLRTIWGRADPDVDPYFAYDNSGTIEDLLDHWERMIKISYDSGTGLIDLRVLAFAPEDAKLIAEEIHAQSNDMINQLSAIAREDAIGYARDELTQSVERLKKARTALTEFRNRTQIVDPTIDTQGQMGLLNALNSQLADAQIELEVLKETTRDSDPRIESASRKIRVIQTQIDAERQKLGIGAGGGQGQAFANLVGEYESLIVDREFAETAYTASLATYDAAQAEARRQSRYLALHIEPTLAERAEYPKRELLLLMVSIFVFLAWSVGSLVVYSLRDRR